MKTNLEHPRTSTVNHMKWFLHLLWILLGVSAGAWRCVAKEWCARTCWKPVSWFVVPNHCWFQTGRKERNILYTFHQNMGVQKFKCWTFCVCSPRTMTLWQDEVEEWVVRYHLIFDWCLFRRIPTAHTWLQDGRSHHRRLFMLKWWLHEECGWFSWNSGAPQGISGRFGSEVLV